MILDAYKKRINMTKEEKEEKALEEDYKKYCEMTLNLSDKELNRRYEKYYLLKGD